jgi:hypothetical protein
MRKIFTLQMTFSKKVRSLDILRLLTFCPGIKGTPITFQKNYNNGGVVAEETGTDAQTARISLYHDADHPSYLEIPIAR